MPLTFSIVTPSLNQGKFIEQTIKSVLSQKGHFYIDYIVVDACSTDKSVEIIKKYARLVQSGVWNINCMGIEFRWVSEIDQGQSDGINKGFRMAKGDLLCWLNSDDLYPQGTLDTVAKVNWSATDFIYGKGVWISRSGEKLGIYPTYPPNKFTLSIACTLCQPAVFFTMEAFESLGELSTDYDLVFDYEYWLRAVHAGKKFRCQSDLWAASRMYPENKSYSMTVTSDRERKKLLSSYSSGGSFIERAVKKIWEICIKGRTQRKNDDLRKVVFSGERI